jgi:hypothetical protein
LRAKGLQGTAALKAVKQIVKSFYNPEGMNPDGTKYAKDSSGADNSAIAQKPAADKSAADIAARRAAVRDKTMLKFLGEPEPEDPQFSTANLDKAFASATSLRDVEAARAKEDAAGV